MILSSQIRKNFIEYFKKHGHRVVPSSSTVPHDDPTLLFTNAGMNQFKDLFLGKATADYKRATSSQKCVRVGGKHNDLDNVGHTSRHLTFFEMLGNFSFGDYFKKEAIQFAFEVTMNVFQYDFEKVWVTVYQDDDEAYELWKAYVPEKRIVRLGEKDNFWSMGDVGPCGPCSELYFDRGSSFGTAESILHDVSGERYLEFWNLVFMQFNKELGGGQSRLAKQSIDTGAGLERVVSLKMGVNNVFETDILSSLIHELEIISKVNYVKNSEISPAFHVIADHIRTLSFACADGAQPSNVERGYVLRKLLRRAVRYGKKLGLNDPFLARMVPKLIELMGDDYPELIQAKTRIQEIVTLEEESFLRTLKRGGNILSNIVEKALQDPAKELTSDAVFKLKDTYGFPIEEVLLIAKDTGLSVNLEAYETLENEARERSKKAHSKTAQLASENVFEDHLKTFGECIFLGYDSTKAESTVTGIFKEGAFCESLTSGSEAFLLLTKTPFYAEKGGQTGDSGKIYHQGASFEVITTTSPFPGIILHKGKLTQGTILLGEPVKAEVTSDLRENIEIHHTATHLLHKALQEVLGPHIKQAGSLVESNRLRFDFNHHKAVTLDELNQIEKLVNEWINAGLSVSTYEKDFEEIKGHPDIKQFFGDKYGKIVRIVDILNCSKELCGGTHSSNTKSLILFRVVKESSIGAGVRRIEAVAGKSAIVFLTEKEVLLENLVHLLETDSSKLFEKTKSTVDELKTLKLENKELKKLKIDHMKHQLQAHICDAGNYKLLCELVDCDPADLFNLAQEMTNTYTLDCALLITRSGAFALKLSKALVSQGVSASLIVKELNAIIGSTGGGKDDFAQGKAAHPNHIKQAHDHLNHKLKAL